MGGNMIESILGFFASSGMGAIVGAVGSYFTKVEERKTKELQFKRDLAMAKIDLQAEAMAHSHEISLADKQIEQTQAEGEIAMDVLDGEAFKTSITAALKPTGINWVDAVRGLMRPVITSYMLIVATFLAINISLLVGGLTSLDAEFLTQTYNELIDQVLFLTTLTVSWWFGSRGGNTHG